MTDRHPPPPPVTPPRGGFNDFYPPPAPEPATIEALALRVRRRENPTGAAWRLCTVTQPRSVHELLAHVWPAGKPPSDVAMVLTDTYADWVAAGKPAARARPHGPHRRRPARGPVPHRRRRETQPAPAPPGGRVTCPVMGIENPLTYVGDVARHARGR